jgi:hypothetical protein
VEDTNWLRGLAFCKKFGRWWIAWRLRLAVKISGFSQFQCMPCDRGSCGNILGDIASAKISQASQDELDKLNGQYVHAKRGIGNLHIL